MDWLWRGLIWFVGFLCISPFVVGAAQQPAIETAPMLRIYLGRHGQTDWNVEGRTQGATDTPLNVTGRQQAVMLKERLKDVRLDAVYSSTLSRSRETAEIARGQASLTSLAELGERKAGKFEGLLSNDPATGPEFQRRRWAPDDGLDGGESLNVFTSRIQGAIGAIRSQRRSGSVLIVGHGGTNQMILKILLGLSIEQMRSITQDNDELYLIELEPGKTPRVWKLITEGNLKDL